MEHSPRFLNVVEQARQRVREVDPPTVHQMRQRGEPFHLVDVREPSEWERGHLPGAVHLSKGVIERDIEQAIDDPKAPIVLYCGGGFRSALAAENLQRMGYRQVSSMSGGFRGWKEAGLPVVVE